MNKDFRSQCTCPECEHFNTLDRVQRQTMVVTLKLMGWHQSESDSDSWANSTNDQYTSTLEAYATATGKRNEDPA